MDHQRGYDPTPQGRVGGRHHREAPPKAPRSPEAEKYVNSAPGPSARADGAFFFGYKRDSAYQPEEEKEL
ncbi:MAG: hypothetical protein ACM3XM_06475 [Mycobacterium leprae]